MYLYIPIAVAALVVAAVLTVVIRKHAAKRQTQALVNERMSDIEQWVQRLESAEDDPKTLADAGKMPHSSGYIDAIWGGYRWFALGDELAKRVSEVHSKVQTAKSLERDLAICKNHLKKDDLSGLYETLKVLQKWSGKGRAYLCSGLGTDADQLRQKLQSAVDSWLEELLGKARAGDAVAFHELFDFYRSEWPKIERYQRVGLKFEKNLPDDWDQIVVRCLKSPAVKHFARFEIDMPAGYWRLKAAGIINDGSDLVGALKVLAVANHYEHYLGMIWREEIGDVLLAELARLVDRLRVISLKK